jgi:hypothetical protein
MHFSLLYISQLKRTCHERMFRHNALRALICRNISEEILAVAYLGGPLADSPPLADFFALKKIDESSLIDRSFNWLNLATYPKLNSAMKCTAVTLQ